MDSGYRRSVIQGHLDVGESLPRNLIAPDKLQMVDSTVIRAPHHGGRKRGAPKEAPGRSSGRFTNKTHLRVNGAGLPKRTEITPGQDPDYTRYDMVMADNLPQPAVLVADRAMTSPTGLCL